MTSKKDIYKKAQKAAGNADRMKGILADASVKLKKFASNSKELKEIKSKLHILVRMVQYHISGQYAAFSTASIALVLFALIYFITPIDVIPDFIPALGFTDDASVVLIVYKKIYKDIVSFLEWEKSSKS